MEISMKHRAVSLFSVLSSVLVLAVSLAAQTAPAKAVDISGQWTASFETQIGTQTYTYDFVAKDGKLTGKIKGNLAEAAVDVQEGKVAGDTVTFVETFNFQGMDLRIAYSGKIVSADEIKFTRNVMDFASEELVAKRVKK
jgi:hypothetical protein